MLKVKKFTPPKADKELEMGLSSNLAGVSSLSQDPVSRMIRRNTRAGVIGRKNAGISIPKVRIGKF